MKVTIITPSYNDAKSIVETLDSVNNQTYKDWESIIIDDGSTDNTKDVVEKYKKDKNLEDKIKYIYQENSDQLNALLNGSKYITGDYVFILHSDDLLPSDDFLEKCVSYMKSHSNCDAIIGDLIIINEESQVTNKWAALRYNNSKGTPALLILNNGCNIYGDFSFRKKDCYFNSNVTNYLTWNMPFWIDMDNDAKMVNIDRVKFPILKYRIHKENYANNEVGKFCALNGEIRTLTRLLKIYNIKFYKIQKLLFKLARIKGIRKLGLSGYFYPIYNKKETNNRKKTEIIKNTILNTYTQEEYTKNTFLDAVINFYDKLAENQDRTITYDNKEKSEIYKGKDIRIFTKKLFDNQLPILYINMLKEMKLGFNKIIVDESEYEDVVNILKFLCIYPYVEIIKK